MTATPPPEQAPPPDDMPAQADPPLPGVSPDNKQDLTTAATTVCPLLDLSAELRNEIWELSFTTDNEQDEEGYIDLVKSASPSNSLLLVSRQVYQEARGFYRTANCRYWSESKFILNAFDTSKEEIRAMKSADLSHVSNVRVRDQCGGDGELVDSRGIWYHHGYLAWPYWVAVRGADTEEWTLRVTPGDLKEAEEELEKGSRVPLAEQLAFFCL